MNKLIAIDVDGTLVDERCLLSVEAVSYLRELSNRGHMIVLATGRPVRSTLPFYKRIGLSSPLICYNGEYTFSPIDDSFPKRELHFEKEKISRILKQIKGHIISFMSESLTDIYQNVHDPILNKFFPKDGMDIHIEDEPSFKDDLMTFIAKIDFCEGDFIKDVVKKEGDIAFRLWKGLPYGEIHHHQGEKGKALKYIMDYYGFKKEDVIAFGDSTNDISMLEEAGLPFSIKGCKSEILKERFPQTEKGSADNGVIYELKKLFG